jgi:hypothetical protein
MVTYDEVLGPIPGRVQQYGVAVARYGHRAERYVQSMWWGDPLADAFVADMETLGHHQGMTMLTAALANGIDTVDDAPASLRQLFAQLDRLPFWLDPARVDRGADNLVSYSHHAAIALGAASLISGYSNPAAIAPMVVTGRYLHEAAVRTVETGTWLTAITRPGGLTRNGTAFALTVRVRIIHALVRAAVRKDWDTTKFATPIAQADLAFTIVEFGWIALNAFQRMGVRYTPDELGDIYHLWRYIGYLIGVDERILPVDAYESEQIYRLYHLLREPADATCRAFTNSITEAFLIPELGDLLGPARPLARPIISGLERAFLGDKVADELRITDNLWKYAPAIAGPLIALGYRAADLVPGAKRRRLRWSRAYIDRRVKLLGEKYGVSHDLVDKAPAQHPAAVA